MKNTNRIKANEQPTTAIQTESAMPIKARQYILETVESYCEALLCSRQQANVIAEWIEEITGQEVTVRTVEFFFDVGDTRTLAAFVHSS